MFEYSSMVEIVFICIHYFITRIGIVLIEMRDGCFVHVFERPEGLGGPV